MSTRFARPDSGRYIGECGDCGAWASGAAGLRFVRTGLGPAGLFGVAVSGMTRGRLGQIRRIFHAATVKRPSGRSATVDLELVQARSDPAFQANSGPGAWLCKKLVCKSSPSIMIAECVEAALQASAKVRGPVSAAVPAARDIGWQREGKHIWSTAAGVLLDLSAEDRWLVRQIADADTEAWLWRQAAQRHAHLAHLDGPPHLAALRQLLRHPGQLTANQRYSIGLVGSFRVAVPSNWRSAHVGWRRVGRACPASFPAAHRRLLAHAVGADCPPP